MKKKWTLWVQVISFFIQIQSSLPNPNINTTTTNATTTTATTSPNYGCNATQFIDNQSANECAYCMDCPDADHEHILGGMVTNIQRVSNTVYIF